MGAFVDRDRFEALMALAEPMMAYALETAQEMALEMPEGSEGLEDEARAHLEDIQRGTQALATGIQALMLGTTLPEVSLILALATSLGTVLGQAASDRTALWASFNERVAQTMKDVAIVQMPTEGSA